MRIPTPATPTTEALTKNAAELVEAEEYVSKLQAERVDLVARARREGVTWRSVEEITGTTRQTLAKVLGT